MGALTYFREKDGLLYGSVLDNDTYGVKFSFPPLETLPVDSPPGKCLFITLLRQKTNDQVAK